MRMGAPYSLFCPAVIDTKAACSPPLAFAEHQFAILAKLRGVAGDLFERGHLEGRSFEAAELCALCFAKRVYVHVF